MTGQDTIQFVDSIASSPTVRLDLNDETSWWARSFLAPPPALRRSATSNAMTDGIHVSSSTYDARVLTIQVDLRTASQDTNAAAFQALARELDRVTNILRYQPNGASKPVFFKTHRSSIADVEDITVSAAHRILTFELLAEPFAYGLRETISAGTVSNDPAVANGCYIDVTGVIGDVAAEPVITFGTDVTDTLVLATLPDPAASLPVTVQAEAMTLGTDTTNPGGAADAAMSGSGTTNYRRTSFATTSLSTRLSWSASTQAERDALTGSWRLLAAVRLSNNTTTVRIQPAWAGDTLSAYYYGELVTPALTANRQLIDLGIVTFGTVGDIPGGATLSLSAQRDSGTGTLDWDYLMFVPVTATMARIGPSFNTVDTPQQVAYMTEPTAADRWTTTGYTTGTAQTTGGFPTLQPNVTNRLYWTVYAADPILFGALDKTKTSTVTVNYHPRYQFVRPLAS